MQLSIIILNYNTKDLLIQLINSINTSVPHELIVVDNNSTDGSLKYIETHFPHVKLIALPQNVGFAAGNNQGIKSALGNYILLLNSDTQLKAQAIEKSIKYLQKHPDVGILSPKLILPDGSIDLACHRGFPTPANSLTYFAKLEQWFPNFKPFSGYHQTWKDFDTVHQVDAVSGAAMFIRKKVLDQIGLFDEQFFMYAEDIDLCHRAKNSGWKVIYYPKAQVLHHKGMSGTKSNDRQIKSTTRHHFYQTMKQYFHKHYGHKQPKFATSLINLGIDIIAKIKK